jgi:hypothetical protein
VLGLEDLDINSFADYHFIPPALNPTKTSALHKHIFPDEENIRESSKLIFHLTSFT